MKILIIITLILIAPAEAIAQDIWGGQRVTTCTTTRGANGSLVTTCR